MKGDDVMDAFSFKETLIEVRDDVKGLRTDFENFKGDAMDFRTKVVLKSEIKLWEEAKRSTRRWAITTIIAVAGMLVMAVALANQIWGT